MAILGFGLLGAIAYGLRTGLFVLLNTSLSYVDERLTMSRPDLLTEAVQGQVRVNRKIFISYRREDSSAYTRLVRQSLLEYMDESQIFMDIMAIHDGEDFVNAIDDAILKCDALIVIIGKDWVDCSDQEGRRIMKDDDFVRLEIAAALRQERLVIPTLVDGSAMPHADDLPNDIKALARRQARELSDTRWEYDISQLAATLAEVP